MSGTAASPAGMGWRGGNRDRYLNVQHPATVVAEMIRIARPGGVVALQEPDSSGWLCDPPHPAWDPMVAELLDRPAYDVASLGRQAAGQ